MRTERTTSWMNHCKIKLVTGRKFIALILLTDQKCHALIYMPICAYPLLCTFHAFIFPLTGISTFYSWSLLNLLHAECAEQMLDILSYHQVGQDVGSLSLVQIFLQVHLPSHTTKHLRHSGQDNFSLIFMIPSFYFQHLKTKQKIFLPFLWDCD